MKKKSPKAKNSSGPTADRDHYTGVLVEEIRSQMELVIEKVEGVEGRLNDRIDNLETKFTQKLAGTQIALGRRIEGVENKLEETREELSGKIDAIGLRLDRHDEGIAELKKVQNS